MFYLFKKTLLFFCGQFDFTNSFWSHEWQFIIYFKIFFIKNKKKLKKRKIWPKSEKNRKSFQNSQKFKFVKFFCLYGLFSEQFNFSTFEVLDHVMFSIFFCFVTQLVWVSAMNSGSFKAFIFRDRKVRSCFISIFFYQILFFFGFHSPLDI